MKSTYHAVIFSIILTCWTFWSVMADNDIVYTPFVGNQTRVVHPVCDSSVFTPGVELEGVITRNFSGFPTKLLFRQGRDVIFIRAIFTWTQKGDRIPNRRIRDTAVRIPASGPLSDVAKTLLSIDIITRHRYSPYTPKAAKVSVCIDPIADSFVYYFEIEAGTYRKERGVRIGYEGPTEKQMVALIKKYTGIEQEWYKTEAKTEETKDVQNSTILRGRKK